jgi:O-antigen ligase
MPSANVAISLPAPPPRAPNPPAAVAAPFPFARKLAPDWPLLIEIAVCSVPAMALVALTLLRPAAFYFFAVHGLLLSYKMVRRDPKGMMCLILGCLPAAMLLRNFFSYSSVEVILGLGFLCWMLQDRADIDRLFRDLLVRHLFCFVVLYWLLSFAITGDYSSNLRIFELLLTALGIRLLGKYRSLLGTSLLGLAVTTFAMGLAFSRFGERLGMAEIDGERLGNPISFGIPMSLIFLLSLAENGRWLLLEGKATLRILINIGAGILLLLSTSRGSWAVVSVSLLILLVGQRNRLKLVSYLGVITLALLLWDRLGDSAVVQKYMSKTFDSAEYWSAENNARVAQWESFPRAFADAPAWGFGPGTGKAVSLKYSGHKLIWHSLYLHMSIECGFIGACLLAFFLLTLIARAIRYARWTGEFAPLIGIAGFMVVASTIPAIDGASGLFLGFALLSCETTGLWVLRTATPAIAKTRAPYLPAPGVGVLR